MSRSEVFHFSFMNQYVLPQVPCLPPWQQTRYQIIEVPLEEDKKELRKEHVGQRPRWFTKDA